MRRPKRRDGISPRVLERDAGDLGGSSIVVIVGLSKPKRSVAAPKDYRRARAMRDEFGQRRTVLE